MADPSLGQVVRRAAKDKQFFLELLKAENPLTIVDKAKITLTPGDRERLVKALKYREKQDVNCIRLFQLIHGMMKDDEWVECCIEW